MTIVEKARKFAEKHHQHQLYGKEPYIHHLEETVNVLKRWNCDVLTLVAGYLHDILEDTPLSYNDLKEEFGKEVAEIVYCVTDELGRNRFERKIKTYPKIKSNLRSTIVKIADRIANIENAKKTHNRMFDIYVNEQHEFYSGLSDPLIDSKHPLLSVAWSDYAKCFQK